MAATLALVYGVAMVLAGTAWLEAGQAAATRGEWFTKAQAARGLVTYRSECARCHGEGLLGSESGPPLVGDTFLTLWKDRTAADLFALLRDTMPQDSPGRLPATDYADVLAYMLAGNDFPAGANELPADAARLKTMILRPGQDAR